MSQKRLVLASASPRRRELLTEQGWEVEVAPTHVEEIDDDGWQPHGLALENARRKFFAAADIHAHGLLLAADTVVWLDGRFFAKPRDLVHAQEMLRQLAGRTHLVVTGVVLRDALGSIRELTVESRVSFHPLSDAQIDGYLSREHVLDKAGAYAAQGDDGSLIAAIEGSKSNVIGLPVEALIPLLHEDSTATDRLKMAGA